MKIEFFKYHGTGNDFIIIDNTKKLNIDIDHKLVSFLCHRKFGIGADGLIFINKVKDLDFEIDYYNSDGSKSFCGNGTRCSVAFAKKIGLIKNNTKFKAIDGEHYAEIKNNLVYLQMNEVDKIISYDNEFEINTGSPHFIKFVDNSSLIDVFDEGRKIRYSPQYQEQGINVNFVKIINTNSIEVSTYERGVENETLSCGTGVVASSIAYSEKNKFENGYHSIDIITKGGNLKVNFEKNENYYKNIFLIGPAINVFKGKIKI